MRVSIEDMACDECCGSQSSSSSSSQSSQSFSSLSSGPHCADCCIGGVTAGLAFVTISGTGHRPGFGDCTSPECTGPPNINCGQAAMNKTYRLTPLVAPDTPVLPACLAWVGDGGGGCTKPIGAPDDECARLTDFLVEVGLEASIDPATGEHVCRYWVFAAYPGSGPGAVCPITGVPDENYAIYYSDWTGPRDCSQDVTCTQTHAPSITCAPTSVDGKCDISGLPASLDISFV